MDKVQFKNSRGINLTGVFHETDDPVAAVVMVHGFTSHKESRGKFVKMGELLSSKGILAFRYDAGGSGESESAPVTVENYVDDLMSAIKLVKEKGINNIGLLGSSLGGLCAIRAYDKSMTAMVLWAPVTMAQTPQILDSSKMRKKITEQGFITINKRDRDFTIPKKYLVERETLRHKELLSRVKCPTLIIHGTEDLSIPLKHSKWAMKFLTPKSELKAIKGADHYFTDHGDEIVSLSLNWFKKYLQ